jgi:hypothetical protein
MPNGAAPGLSIASRNGARDQPERDKPEDAKSAFVEFIRIESRVHVSDCSLFADPDISVDARGESGIAIFSVR